MEHGVKNQTKNNRKLSIQFDKNGWYYNHCRLVIIERSHRVDGSYSRFQGFDQNSLARQGDKETNQAESQCRLGALISTIYLEN